MQFVTTTHATTPRLTCLYKCFKLSNDQNETKRKSELARRVQRSIHPTSAVFCIDDGGTPKPHPPDLDVFMKCCSLRCRHDQTQWCHCACDYALACIDMFTPLYKQISLSRLCSRNQPFSLGVYAATPSFKPHYLPSR